MRAVVHFVYYSLMATCKNTTKDKRKMPQGWPIRESKTQYSDRPPIVVIKMFEITKDLNLKKSKSNYYTLAINMQG